jgi:hypothetical protein
MTHEPRKLYAYAINGHPNSAMDLAPILEQGMKLSSTGHVVLFDSSWNALDAAHAKGHGDISVVEIEVSGLPLHKASSFGDFDGDKPGDWLCEADIPADRISVFEPPQPIP